MTHHDQVLFLAPTCYVRVLMASDTKERIAPAIQACYKSQGFIFAAGVRKNRHSFSGHSATAKTRTSAMGFGIFIDVCLFVCYVLFANFPTAFLRENPSREKHGREKGG